jgi:hypothetical protein
MQSRSAPHATAVERRSRRRSGGARSAKLRSVNIDASRREVEEIAQIVAQIRACWPYVRIILRADSALGARR